MPRASPSSEIVIASDQLATALLGFFCHTRPVSRSRTAASPNAFTTLKRLALSKAAHILQEHSQVSFGNARRKARDMRRNNYIFHLPERMGGGQGLDLEHVESRSGNFAGLQGSRQVGQVHDGATSDVDEIGTAFHLL